MNNAMINIYNVYVLITLKYIVDCYKNYLFKVYKICLDVRNLWMFYFYLVKLKLKCF